MSNDIYILSGPVQTGKTTRLMEWCSNKENVYGIATPIVQGMRVFYDLHKKTIFPMEADIDDKDILQIGKYIFSHMAFQKAEKIIADGITSGRVDEYTSTRLPSHLPRENVYSSTRLLVIDEIGPLELRGEGFNNVIKKILSIEYWNFKLVLIIRNSLLNDVLNSFRIKNYHTLDI